MIRTLSLQVDDFLVKTLASPVAFDAAITLFETQYLHDELICESMGLANADESTKADLRAEWRCVLSLGISLGVYDLRGELIGANLLYIGHRTDPPERVSFAKVVCV